MLNSNEKSNSQRMLESELERAITALRAETIEGEEYAKRLRIVETLDSLLDKEKPKTLSKETILNVAANLIGILMIIKHENVNVITSKALGFVSRLR